MLTSQNPASATIAWAGRGPASHRANCGTVSTNAIDGSQRHERKREIAVVPMRVTATNRSVSVVGSAPMTGGAISAAMRPYAATSRASYRMAMTAAAIAATSAPTRPSSGGSSPYARVAANRAIDTHAKARRP